MRKKFLGIIVVLFTIIILIYFNIHKSPDAILKTTFKEDKIKNIINNMTLEEKIGQLFIVRPDSLLDREDENFDQNTVLENMKTMIETYNVGGVCLFSNNIKDKEQLLSFNSSLQSVSKYGMFISVDEEGGLVSRIANNNNFEIENVGSMEDVGLSNDLNKAYNIGITIGSYLKEYGINLDFAPVADVNTNPDNIVIGERSFGSNPNIVGKMVASTIKGFHNQNVMTCVKHFPGHGDTSDDTHNESVIVNKTWEEMLKNEIIPFEIAVKEKTDFIMISHIIANNVSNDELPSSLSKNMIDKLKKELKYDGLIITDAMEMGAIANHYSSGESAIKAINAGIDIILMPENFVEAYETLLNSVRNGEISEKRIDESVYKILSKKNEYKIIKND